MLMMQNFSSELIVNFIVFFQQIIDAFVTRCTSWQLKINICKCLYISYGVVIRPFINYDISGSIVLRKVKSIKDHGITFGSKIF